MTPANVVDVHVWVYVWECVSLCVWGGGSMCVCLYICNLHMYACMNTDPEL